LLRDTVLRARHSGQTWEQVGAVAATSAEVAIPELPVTHYPPIGTTYDLPDGFEDNPPRPNRAGRYSWHAIKKIFDSCVSVLDNQQWEHTTAYGKAPLERGGKRYIRGRISSIGRGLPGVRYCRATLIRAPWSRKLNSKKSLSEK